MLKSIASLFVTAAATLAGAVVLVPTLAAAFVVGVSLTMSEASPSYVASMEAERCDKDRRDAGQCQAPCGFMRKCSPRTPTK